MLCTSNAHDLLKASFKRDIIKDYSKQWKHEWSSSEGVSQIGTMSRDTTPDTPPTPPHHHWKEQGRSGAGSTTTPWKTEGHSSRSIDTTSSSWVNDIRGTEQEKLVEQALNLDLSNLSEKQLIEIFIAVTDLPESKAKKWIYDSNKDLILAFQSFFDHQNKRNARAETDASSTHRPPQEQQQAGYTPASSTHITAEEREPPECASFNDGSSGSSTFTSSTVKRKNSRSQRDSFSKDCAHRCCMVHADACCYCSDHRPELDYYDIMIKDEGYCTTPYRWLFYCPVCKRRTQGDSQRSSGSYAPLYHPKGRQRACSKHRVCPPNCSKGKDSCVIC